MSTCSCGLDDVHIRRLQETFVRKYPNPRVHVSTLHLIRGNSHEKPAFLISNDFDSPLELLVGNYARRWGVENGIAVDGKGTIQVRNGRVIVSFPRRAHNPILRGVPWANLPATLPTHEGAKLSLNFD